MRTGASTPGRSAPDKVVDVLEASRARGVDPASRVLLVGAASGEWRPSTPYTLAAAERAVAERARELTGEVEPGRVHPFVMEADEEGIFTLLALWRLGVTPAPLNPRLTEVERTAAEAALWGQEGEGAQVVLWTSGTSGAPRGVALGFRALARHVAMVRERLELRGPGDTWLATLSPAHVGGLALLLRSLLTGSLLVAGGVPNPAEVAGALDEGVGSAGRGGHRVTHLSLVPTQLLRLLDVWGDRPAPRGLRCVLVGGAHTPAHLLKRALEGGWPVALTWGMTEMASQVATAPPAAVRRKPGSVGRPLDGVEVQAGPDGQLRVRSPAAASALLDGRPLLSDDGWYKTGDLGRVDEDGDVWITGRRSDRIVSGGVTVDANEVEEALRTHPAVAEACVVGVPDSEWGERVGAWVVPVAGEFDLEELEGWLRERLAPAKRPRIWKIGNRLPLNANGKVDRAEVRVRLL